MFNSVTRTTIETRLLPLHLSVSREKKIISSWRLCHISGEVYDNKLKKYPAFPVFLKTSREAHSSELQLVVRPCACYIEYRLTAKGSLCSHFYKNLFF